MKRNLLLFFAMILASIGMSGQVTSVAVVGEAAGGWPGDPGNPGPTDVHQMTDTGDGIHWTLSGLVLTQADVSAGPNTGGIKFRANNTWDINWGDVTFPTGTGTQGGTNIQCYAGTFDVTFNSSTGEYAFVGGTPPPTVTLDGTAVSSGPVSLSPATGTNYKAFNVTLLAGNAQFTISNDGASPYGGVATETSPGIFEGDAIDPSTFISVPAGTYTTVEYDISNGHYIFTAAPVFQVISIIGNAALGWADVGNDTDLSTTDGLTYSGTVMLTAWDGVAGSGTGELKFRTNHDWSQTSYGGQSFPDGPDPAHAGDNIVVTTAGTYDVTFNRTTGAYSFFVPTIAIVGDATAQGWPVDPQVDGNQMISSDNGMMYYLPSITLTDVNGTGGQAAVKLRSNNSWDAPNKNWGGIVFPTGIATVGGGNIDVTTPGTYGVTFNRITGELAFGPELATKGFNKSGFVVYPNPSHNTWNFSAASNEKIAAVRIVDMLGKTVLSVNADAASASVDASTLNAGVYFAKVATASGETTVKVVKN